MVADDNGAKGKGAGPRAWFRDLDRLLSGDLTGVNALRERGLAVSAWRLSICIVVLAMSYGICMGVYGAFREKNPTPMQVVASMVKVPLVFYLTLLVTLPSLYVFNALVGSRLSLPGVVRLLIASIGVNVTVLASLGPIVAFFSVCTTSYPFMLLLNVAAFAVAGLFGLRFLLQTLQRLTVAASQLQSPAEGAVAVETPRDRAIADQVRTVFRVWVIVFCLVGAQMGWVLRPFVGNPNVPFAWFRARHSNFFMAVLEAISKLFS